METFITLPSPSGGFNVTFTKTKRRRKGGPKPKETQSSISTTSCLVVDKHYSLSSRRRGNSRGVFGRKNLQDFKKAHFVLSTRKT